MLTSTDNSVRKGVYTNKSTDSEKEACEQRDTAPRVGKASPSTNFFPTCVPSCFYLFLTAVLSLQILLVLCQHDDHSLSDDSVDDLGKLATVADAEI